MFAATFFFNCFSRIRTAPDSLARPLGDAGYSIPEDDPEEDNGAEETKKANHAEAQQGFQLWRSIRRVVCLTVNVRASDALGRLRAEMRAGRISDAMWELYISRVLEPRDPRLSRVPFAEKIASSLPYTGAGSGLCDFRTMLKISFRRLCEPLYIVQAKDEAVRSEESEKLTDTVQADLLHRVNPEQTKG